jgi:hypothetical protein
MEAPPLLMRFGGATEMPLLSSRASVLSNVVGSQ